MASPRTTSAGRTATRLSGDREAEIELLDPDTFDVPRRLSERERLHHIGAQGRREPTQLEQDHDQ